MPWRQCTALRTLKRKWDAFGQKKSGTHGGLRGLSFIQLHLGESSSDTVLGPSHSPAWPCHTPGTASAYTRIRHSRILPKGGQDGGPSTADGGMPPVVASFLSQSSLTWPRSTSVNRSISVVLLPAGETPIRRHIERKSGSIMRPIWAISSLESDIFFRGEGEGHRLGIRIPHRKLVK